MVFHFRAISPNHYWQRTSAHILDLPVTQLLFATRQRVIYSIVILSETQPLFASWNISAFVLCVAEESFCAVFLLRKTLHFIWYGSCSWRFSVSSFSRADHKGILSLTASLSLEMTWLNLLTNYLLFIGKPFIEPRDYRVVFVYTKKMPLAIICVRGIINY